MAGSAAALQIIGATRGFAPALRAPSTVTFILENWPLILLALVSGGMLAWPMIGKGGVARVSPAEAVRLMNCEKGVLIDVCESAEFAAGHAAGARNVPLSALAGAKELPANKALPVIVMCASGARAGRAAAQLRRAGYERAVAVSGGNGAWREAGLPLEKAR